MVKLLVGSLGRGGHGSSTSGWGARTLRCASGVGGAWRRGVSGDGAWLAGWLLPSLYPPYNAMHTPGILEHPPTKLTPIAPSLPPLRPCPAATPAPSSCAWMETPAPPPRTCSRTSSSAGPPPASTFSDTVSGFAAGRAAEENGTGEKTSCGRDAKLKET